MADVAATYVGTSKGSWPVVTRTVSAPDKPGDGYLDLASIASTAVDIGLNPCVDIYGSSDTQGSDIDLALALFDENKNPLGLTLTMTLMASTTSTFANQYPGDNPTTLYVGSARYVALVVLGVTERAKWTINWRPFGQLKYPA